MRSAALMFAVVAGLAPAAAVAADGRLGPVSSASVTIRVSVAPRAWQAGGGGLCVKGPVGGYRITAESGAPPVALAKGSSPCPMQADRWLPSDTVAEGGTLLIVPL